MQEEAIEQIHAIVPEQDWTVGLYVWSKFFSFDLPVLPTPQIQPQPSSTPPEVSELTGQGPKCTYAAQVGRVKTFSIHKLKAGSWLCFHNCDQSFVASK